MFFLHCKDPNEPDLYGVKVSRTAYKFHLNRHTGEKFSLESNRGKYTFLFFGFSHCTSTCPPMLRVMQSIAQKITKKSLSLVYITIDPKRDKQEHLAVLQKYLGSKSVVLTGSEKNIKSIAKEYGVFFQEELYQTDDNYQLHHSGNLYLIDPQLKIRLLYPSGYYNITKIYQDFISLRH
ncbi:MAG: SCO family protein [Spirochaetota bacterium]